MEGNREIWIDWMRVISCFLVMVIHSTEPFYLGGDGTLLLSKTDAFWVALFDSFARACVPVFVVASSYLLFPIRYSTREFFQRRVVRILIPFLIWTIVYALVWGEPVQNFKDLLFNFNYAAGHLWFVYMIVGLYLVMPLLSPWAEKVGRKELLFFLGLCFLFSFIPFIREAGIGSKAVCIYGPGGIPMQAKYPLWGEASWNEFGIFYYLSGFIGYLLLGLYLRKFGSKLNWGRTLAVALPCFLIGFVVCVCGFINRVMETSGGVFPIGGECSVAAVWETPWFYDTFSVALMTIGWVLFFRKFHYGGRFFRCVVLPVSKASYGMYLCLMLVLSMFAALYRGTLGIGAEGSIGIMTTPVEIILTAVSSFITTALACVLVQKFSHVGRYVVG
ncbi:MAG: acyltransferase family protein [Alistipes sp.]|nr:acyltransferase family protein [Candidatus Alistipes equi]